MSSCSNEFQVWLRKSLHKELKKQMLNHNCDPCLYVSYVVAGDRQKTQSHKKHIGKSRSWQIMPQEPWEPEELTHLLSPQTGQLIVREPFPVVC